MSKYGSCRVRVHVELESTNLYWNCRAKVRVELESLASRAISPKELIWQLSLLLVSKLRPAAVVAIRCFVGMSEVAALCFKPFFARWTVISACCSPWSWTGALQGVPPFLTTSYRLIYLLLTSTDTLLLNPNHVTTICTLACYHSIRSPS